MTPARRASHAVSPDGDICLDIEHHDRLAVGDRASAKMARLRLRRIDHHIDPA